MPTLLSGEQSDCITKKFSCRTTANINSDNPKSGSSYPSCDEHPEEELKFYCCNCQETVCRDCIVIRKHQKHDIENIRDTAAHMKAEMNINLEMSQSDM